MSRLRRAVRTRHGRRSLAEPGGQRAGVRGSAAGAGASQLPLFAAARLDLDLARLDALLERQGQLQHAVLVGRRQLLDVEELRHREGLLVADLVAAPFTLRDLGL